MTTSLHADQVLHSPTTVKADVAPPTPYIRLIAGTLYQICRTSEVHEVEGNKCNISSRIIAASIRRYSVLTKRAANLNIRVKAV